MNMPFKCGVCKKSFRKNYLGGIRDSVNWGNNIICGSCYNKGHDSLKPSDIEEKRQLEWY